jgi:triosephosphate isomerase
MRRKIVTGNWKMNKTLFKGKQLVKEILSSTDASSDVLKIIAPPFIHLAAIADMVTSRTDFAVAAQDCHHLSAGAYTGEVSAEMIASTGAEFVIIGHSERRLYAEENNELLAKKVNIALLNNLSPIFCIGENSEERNENIHLEAVRKQIKEGLFHLSAADFSRVIIAYEPVWAIGTGLTATSHQAQGVQNFIRTEINKNFGKLFYTLRWQL